jgi:DNA-binding transcriptional MocR family regulator
MSIRVMSRVWDSGPDNATECLLLLALADYCDDAGECYPSIAGLARKSRMSERGVQTVMRRLQAAGWVEIEVGGGRRNCNLYRVKTPQQSAENPAPGAPRTRCTPHMNAETPQESARNPAPGAPEPSRTIIEPSKKSAREAGDILEALCHALSEPVAGDFIAHRRTKRSPLTLKAAQLIAKKLAMHPDPDSVVEESIANGWTGVFPESVNSQNQNGGQYGNGNHDARRATAHRSAHRADAALEQIARLTGLDRTFGDDCG